MKYKVKELLGMKNALQKLLSQDILAVISYELSKVVAVFNKEFEVYTDARKKLFNKLAVKGEDDEKKTIPKGKIKDFQTELDKLHDLEVEIKVKKIKISSLGTVRISPVDLDILHKIIEK